MRAVTPIAAFLMGCVGSLIAVGAPSGQPALELPAGHDHETVPLQRAGAWLLARVTINGKDAGLFMVDTGASMTVIDQDAAEKLGLTAPATRGRMTSGSHSTISTKAYRIDSLSVGGATMHNIVIGGAVMRTLAR